MAEPIYPRGFTKLKKVYSGNVEGKPRGMLPLEERASAFFYVHSIERMLAMTPAIFDAAGHGGSWTIQIREANTEQARIIFEQSVQLDITMLGGFGGLLTAWFPHSNSAIKFKTRICDGGHVPAVIPPHLPGHSGPAAPPTGYPGIPELPKPFNVHVDRCSFRMPSLPSSATELNLLVCQERYGTYQLVTTLVRSEEGEDIPTLSLEGGQEAKVTLGAVNNALSPNLVTDLEGLWWKVRAINGVGFTDGEAVRDAWNTFHNNVLVEGYRGYLYGYGPLVTEHYESYYTLNESAAGGSFNVRVSGDIVMPAYECTIPRGAHFDILSDYWVGQLSNNNLYYSISYKPILLPGADSVLDHPTGTIWSLSSQSGSILCGRSTRFETFNNSVDAGEFGDLPIARWVKCFRYGLRQSACTQMNEQFMRRVAWTKAGRG